MTKRWRLHLEAEAELDDAFRWYEEQRKGLGRAFVTDVRKRIRAVDKMPQIARRIPDAPPGFLQVRLERFPYLIRFRDRPDERFVVAISHDRRDPLYWLGRAD